MEQSVFRFWAQNLYDHRYDSFCDNANEPKVSVSSPKTVPDRQRRCKPMEPRLRFDWSIAGRASGPRYLCDAVSFFPFFAGVRFGRNKNITLNGSKVL